MTTTMMPGSTMCSAPLCDDHAHVVNTTQCGQCECDPGWAGPGSLCAPDTDNDGLLDEWELKYANVHGQTDSAE